MMFSGKPTLEELDVRIRDAIRTVRERPLTQEERSQVSAAVTESVFQLEGKWTSNGRTNGVCDSENLASGISELVRVIAEIQFGIVSREEVEGIFATHEMTLPSMQLLDDERGAVERLGNQLLKGLARRTAFEERRETQDAATIDALAAARRTKKYESNLDVEDRDRSAALLPTGGNVTPHIEFGVEQRLDVQHAMATLSPRQKRIVVDRHLLGFKIKEIATSLSVSVETIRRELRAAESKLKQILGPDREEVSTA